MINQFVVVGRIADVDIGNCTVLIRCQRLTKNDNDYYDEDLISIDLRKVINIEVIKELRVDNLIGVKGFIESYVNNDASVTMRLIADKVTIMSTVTKEDESEEI